ncbi:hypothetical protein DFA_04921 [Cavenderia fasciculata]|uniref:Rab GTPase n=1 Tax=Cavenderia fasciculata TaxID=261658 RepID=F4PME1_CACFS|nr:uncharacterized protein DFA_04921 [Cavenderia fasciculata]EGG22791.1 hypothetical protein DFA_04921 [Cavenderia fasciculata]|eukprot:XP_004360642.1 hypothetical protein DFA_04921 [Cavenderia fasciculata]
MSTPKIVPFRIVFVGDGGSGKTTLVQGLFDVEPVLERESFNYPYSPAERFYDQSVSALNIQIFIYRAQRFDRRQNQAYGTARLAVVVVDVTNQVSISNIGNWCGEIERYSHDNIHVLVVGMKCDVDEEDRVMSKEEINAKIKTFSNHQYIEMCRDDLHKKKTEFMHIVKNCFNGEVMSCYSTVQPFYSRTGQGTPAQFGAGLYGASARLHLDAIRCDDSHHLPFQLPVRRVTYTIEAAANNNSQPICDQLFQKVVMIGTARTTTRDAAIPSVFKSVYLVRKIFGQVREIHRQLGLWTVPLSSNNAAFWCSHPRLVGMLRYKFACGHDPIQFELASHNLRIFLRNNRDLDLMKRCCDLNKTRVVGTIESWFVDDAWYQWTVHGFMYSVIFGYLDITKYISQNSTIASPKLIKASRKKDKSNNNNNINNNNNNNSDSSILSTFNLSEHHIKEASQLALNND